DATPRRNYGVTCPGRPYRMLIGFRRDPCGRKRLHGAPEFDGKTSAKDGERPSFGSHWLSKEGFHGTSWDTVYSREDVGAKRLEVDRQAGSQAEVRRTCRQERRHSSSESLYRWAG